MWNASALGWPVDEDPVEIRRTHVSEVYLGRTRVLKFKRPVDLGFVNFTERPTREAACHAEVRLNRRLAPEVYLGVREVAGEPAVEMVRLPDEDAMLARLEAGTLDRDNVVAVAERMARFHETQAAQGAEIDTFGRYEVLYQNALDNYDQSASLVGVTLHPTVFARARARTLAVLQALRERLDARVAAGRIRDTHGDLRLEHVYLRDGQVVVIDCIEFADRFRYSDVALDIAFLAMDLIVRSRRDLAEVLLERWKETTGDEDAAALWPLYVSYRSAVRAKVAGITVADPTTGDDRRTAQLARARRHWLLADSELRAHSERACIVGIGGRPGTGKSTLARALPGFTVIRSDVVRKEAAEAVAYTDAARDAVYEQCFARAEEALFRGERVVVDASFTRAAWRDGLRAVGLRWGVPVHLVQCVAPDEVVRGRLRARTADVSDADESVYDKVRWEEQAGEALVVIDTSQPDAVERALAAFAGPAAP